MDSYTNIPNLLFDLFPTMKEAELKVTIVLCRKLHESYGHPVLVSTDEFVSTSGLSRVSVVNGVTDAVSRGSFAKVPGLNAEDAIALIGRKTPQQFPDGATTLRFCSWCRGCTLVLHNHHYPITRRDGGTTTVAICPNCHAEYHFLISDQFQYGPLLSNIEVD